MNRRLLIKFLNSFRETKKACFIVELYNREKSFKFHVTRESVRVQVYDRATGINELDLVNCEIESILPPGDYKIKCITEKVFTVRNELYSSFYYNCLDYTQVYLPLFRVLGDQVVFLVKTFSGKLEKAFFINGRVFLISKTDDTLEVDQTNLRNLFNNAVILDYERLGRKYNYSTVFSVAENYAKKNGLKISVKKFGFSCQ